MNRWNNAIMHNHDYPCTPLTGSDSNSVDFKLISDGYFRAKGTMDIFTLTFLIVLTLVFKCPES